MPTLPPERRRLPRWLLTAAVLAALTWAASVVGWAVAWSAPRPVPATATVTSVPPLGCDWRLFVADDRVVRHQYALLLAGHRSAAMAYGARHYRALAPHECETP